MWSGFCDVVSAELVVAYGFVLVDLLCAHVESFTALLVHRHGLSFSFASKPGAVGTRRRLAPLVRLSRSIRNVLINLPSLRRAQVRLDQLVVRSGKYLWLWRLMLPQRCPGFGQGKFPQAQMCHEAYIFNAKSSRRIPKWNNYGSLHLKMIKNEKTRKC